MARPVANPLLRQFLLQGSLIGVLIATVGLAALVTHHVRSSMRVELAAAQEIGRLHVRLPLHWLVSTPAVEHGDCVEAEEPPGEQPGRRLRIVRQRSDGLISPLEHLFRSGRIKAELLRALAEGRDGFSRRNLTVAGWPGQFVTAVSALRGGQVHKEVIACAVIGSAQAVVIQLEGAGPLDASDRELVRQMAENVSIAVTAPPVEGTVLDLLDEIKVAAPPRFVLVPVDDPNQLQRQLLFDGSWGSAWTAVDLVSCVVPAEDAAEALPIMLAARNPEWRSGPVRRLGPRTLATDRADGLSNFFPARAYLTAADDGRALLVVVRGGLRDSAIFDGAWDAISSSIRFIGSKDLSTLLSNGAEAAAALRQRGLDQVLEHGGAQDWMIWDQTENADQEVWSQLRWQFSSAGEGPVSFNGSRSALPVDPYATDTHFEQQWSAAADLSRYQNITFRGARRGASQFPRQTLEQRFTADQSRMTLTSAQGPSQSDAELPAQFVPGAILPMVLRELADKPCLLKTETFVDTRTLAPPGLLTLFVTRLADAPLRRDEKGLPMECVTVSVSGAGIVSRWYYTQDQALRFIDFAGGLKAQRAESRR